MKHFKEKVLAISTGFLAQVVLAHLYSYLKTLPHASEALSSVSLTLPIWGHALIIISLLWWAYIEEIFFRSFLWRKIEAKTSTNTAWVLTSLIFAAAHITLSINEVITLIPAAFLFGWWRKKYGPIQGVYLSSYCHIAFNILGILISIT